MVEKKKHATQAKSNEHSKEKEPQSGEEAQASKKSSNSGKQQEDEIFENKDQLSSIVSKGFDLAEAGINLGINLVDKLGSVAQEQLIEKAVNIGRNFTASGDEMREEQARDTAQPYSNEGRAEKESPQSAEVLLVQNRLPLFPGITAQISFSISNYSAHKRKKVRLQVDGFWGEQQGAQIESKIFSIKPTNKLIAPMDFDKFTLTGIIPKNTISDTYSGWILVSGEEELKIPVRLTVTADL